MKFGGCEWLVCGRVDGVHEVRREKGDTLLDRCVGVLWGVLGGLGLNGL